MTESKQQQRSDEKELRFLNEILIALRKINQTISQTRDPGHLLKSTCDTLAQIQGFERCWAVQFDSDTRVIEVVQAGKNDDHPILREQLKGGRLPNCLKVAINKAQMVRFVEGDLPCHACPQFKGYVPGQYVIVTPLMFGQKILGAMVAIIGKDRIFSVEKEKLFEEVAGDLGLALNNLDIEKRRMEAEQELEESEERFRIIMQSAKDIITRIIFLPKLDMEFVSPSVQDILGYTPEEFRYEFTHGAKFIHPDDWSRMDSHLKVDQRLVDPVQVFRALHKDGRVVWIEHRNNFLTDEMGNITASIGIGRDITARIKAEQTLSEEIKRRRILVDQSLDGIVVLDENFKVFEANQKFAEMLGYTPEEVNQLHVFDWDCQIPKERLIEMNPPFKMGGNLLQTRHRRKDGSIYDVEISSNSVEIAGQKLIVCICRDISEHVKAEQTLSDEVQRRRILVDQSLDGIVVLDENFAVFEANRKFADMLGYSPEEVSHLSVFDWEEQVPHDEIIEMMLSENTSGSPFQTKHRRKDGTTFDVEISSNKVIIAGRKLTFCICRDITERISAGKALKESEEKFAKAFRSNPNSTTISTLPEGRFIEINETFTKITGFTREEAIGKTACEIGLWPDATDRQKMMDQLQTKGSVHSLDIKFRTKNGKIIYCRASGEIIDVENRRCLLLIVEDITDQKQAEAQIRLNEARLESLLKISQYENQDIKDLLNFSIEEAVNLTGSQVGFIAYHHQDKEELEVVSWSGPVPDMFKMGDTNVVIKFEAKGLTGEVIRQKKAVIFNDYQSPHPLKKGLPAGHANLTNFMSVPVIRGDDIIAVVSVGNKYTDYDQSDLLQLTLLMDATWKIVEKRQSEEERQRAAAELAELYQKEKQQRLELQEEARARGLFIDVLAHELRTPLTPILASTSMMKDILENSPDNIQKKLAANILVSAHTLARRLEELLDVARYSRGTFKLNLQPVDLNKYIDEVLTRFRPTTDQRKQKLVFELHGNLPVIEIDPSRLEQVLINLLSNASKFSEVNGEIFFRAEADDKAVLLEVRDNGIGISADEQERLFQPYHRVEQDRQRFPGIGLGLAVAKQIVEAHNGKIWLTSESGSGSTFSFKIPVKKV
jgi:PAS domain S-box-containing protein